MRRAGAAIPLLTALAMTALAVACSGETASPPATLPAVAAGSLEPSPSASVDETWPPLPADWWPATFFPTPAATPTPTPSPTTGTATSGRPRYMPSGVIVGDHIFPVQGCGMTYSHYHRYYQATDIYVAKGCKFVASTNGVVDEVSYTDTWDPKVNAGSNRGGISISMIGDDGVRYYGSHMSGIMPGIAPGVRVVVGQQIAYTGQSGDARRSTAHVHYGISWPTRAGIWWVRRGMLYPWPYLDAWNAGKAAYPAGAVAALHAKMGDEPACTAAC